MNATCKVGYLAKTWPCGYNAIVPPPLSVSTVVVIVDGKIAWASGKRLYAAMGWHGDALEELEYVVEKACEMDGA